jgi:hypothetical protein
MSTFEQVVEAVNRQSAAYRAASYEYPGYVAVGPLAFGTENGTWGWCDDEGLNAESDIPGDSKDVERIAKYILDVVSERLSASSLVKPDIAKNPTDRKCYDQGISHAAHGWGFLPWGHWTEEQVQHYRLGFNGQPFQEVLEPFERCPESYWYLSKLPVRK